MLENSYIIAAKRSAVVPRGSAFNELELHELAAPVVRAALESSNVDATEVDEIIVGNSLGGGGNPGRVIGLAAGLSENVAGLSTDRQCCGGLDALVIGDAMIRSGQASVVVAGGAESYSRQPLRSRTFADGRPAESYDQPPFTPWPDRDPDMAEAAAMLSDELGITREEQDRWAIDSHKKALAAVERMRRDEIVSLNNVDNDPFSRELNEKLCQRAKVITGSVTTANTAVAADAAAFCVMVSQEIAKRAGRDAVRFVAGKTAGSDPERPGLAPVPVINALFDRCGIRPADLSVAEIMEAYAVQAIACQRGAGIDAAIVNPGGGALARGHPIGASGAVLAVRLFHQLRATGGTGLAAIAAAGGLGTAVILQGSD